VEGHLETGKKGEKIAQSFLRKKGYKIVTTNYRCALGEIDIIAKDKQCLVFIEVKTRSNESFGSPKLAITYKKQNQLIKVALSYLKQKRLYQPECRFDVLVITFRQEGENNIELIQNAFSLDQSQYFV
jgi:putative endonuclease